MGNVTLIGMPGSGKTTIGKALAQALDMEFLDSDREIERLDLTVPCLYAYCPGCRVLNEQVLDDEPEARCTPALEINGTLRFWGVPASDEALREALSSLLNKD